MEIIEEKQGAASVIRISGRLDSNTSPEFEDHVSAAIRNGSHHMILDFEALNYISSAGLRVILKATKDLKRLEGKLMLCAMRDYVREVFEISGFDSFLTIVSTVDEALERM
ncbi:anti-sigma factor antagonist [Desulfonema ishimotonii]|uniref:Anti-sigma factor antagonist n=1 Tax=Desulfonema ishimotonii TaxID=45657 RepID=A0A401G2S7_9BACT|nr:STAS domain-containing protein [Desulfonema ishimotonii]GBC63483.1 anti-sigma factor antagonist [Desulfonema ishimotonii]